VAAGRLRGVEGVRALAATMVVLDHVWLYGSPDGTPTDLGPLDRLMPQMAAGVLLFFTLSGFLLYRPYAAAILRATGPPRLGGYLRNRALRILPAYWAVLVVTGLVAEAALVRDDGGELVTGSLRDAPGVLLANLALVQSYTPTTFLTGVGPAWSLVIEVAFYVTLPVVALGGLALARRRGWPGRLGAAAAPAVALLGLGLATKAALAVVAPGSSGWAGDWASVAARSFPANADLFAFGMLLAVARVRAEDGQLQLPARWRAGALGAGAALLAVAAVVLRGELGEAPYDTLVVAAFALCLAPLVLPGPASAAVERAIAVLEAPVVLAVGVASYSLFLWHEPLLHWLRERGWTWGGGLGAFLANLLLVGVVAGLLSALSYRFVERPALRRKRSPR
jgi:peptidoglycan/LPS O-acetylase OafA/YrhL